MVRLHLEIQAGQSPAESHTVQASVLSTVSRAPQISICQLQITGPSPSAVQVLLWILTFTSLLTSEDSLFSC